jgi:hypothetical protein
MIQTTDREKNESLINMPWRRVVASSPGRFIPRETTTGTNWIGSWVGLRDGLNAMKKRKIPSPSPESNADHPIVQPVASRYTD